MENPRQCERISLTTGTDQTNEVVPGGCRSSIRRPSQIDRVIFGTPLTERKHRRQPASSNWSERKKKTLKRPDGNKNRKAQNGSQPEYGSREFITEGKPAVMQSLEDYF